MKNYFIPGLLFVFLNTHQSVLAQFAPPVGQPGSTAMFKDSSAFIDWANACSVTRGLQDISDNSLGYTSVGDATMTLGPAGSNGVVSLGDGGSAILQFNLPLADGTGPDFAVFENGFDDTFLELAFVEVSSDGVNYFRIPATSNNDTVNQIASFGTMDASFINNLAGKYRALYGTPFDLAELPANALLNTSAITHVKIIDVVGSLLNEYCTRDQYNHKINDPWPTGFDNGGFDLDAVGVIHNQSNVGIKEDELVLSITMFPNPAKNELHLNTSVNEIYNVSISNTIGDVLIQTSGSRNSTINIENLSDGIYFMTLESENKKVCKRFIKTANQTNF